MADSVKKKRMAFGLKEASVFELKTIIKSYFKTEIKTI